MKRLAYTYTVLQYRHDAWTGECINVGVLVFCPEAGFLKLRTRRGGARLSAAFPGIDRTALRTDMEQLERHFARLSGQRGSDWICKSAFDAATSVLKRDDSSFVWTVNGSGVTDEPEAALDLLFERLVTRYDASAGRAGRTDDQVFETVRKKLKQAELLSHLKEHTVSSHVSEVTFEHAIKNGQWHCIQPLSFDSADKDHMQRKAERWAGLLVGLQDAEPDFRVHIVTGRPTKRELEGHYIKMVELLRRAPTAPHVVEEERSDDLVDELAHLPHEEALRDEQHVKIIRE